MQQQTPKTKAKYFNNQWQGKKTCYDRENIDRSNKDDDGAKYV